MECHSPSVKRRRVLHEHQTNHSESNKDQNLAETSNAKVLVNEDDAVNDEKENLMEGCQIDRFDLETSSPSQPIAKLDMSIESKTDVVNSVTSATEAMNEDNLPPKNMGSCGENGHSHSRKKLLVLDVNGLLVDIVSDPDKAYKADTVIGAKAVFKRPYCDEFLKFCFERFNVGVWTSRTRRNIERVLDFLMKDTRDQLLFCWDQSHCTDTGFNTIENSEKPLVLKELRNLWKKQDPNLPWEKGIYDESNTLLLDDSPYKALRNPPHTAIFPYTYTYRNTQDNGLGPDGDLRNYLEKLAASDNVQKFIEQNPFGQRPITYKNESWKFYLKVIGATSSKPERSRKKLIVIEASGLLVDITSLSREGHRAEGYKAEGYRADTIQGSRAVFKRPYCDEFLHFCFERFNVGVWSSTTRYNTERVLDFLLGDTQNKLLFCWDQTHCTDTGFPTIENISKLLVVKDLRRLWEKQDPNLPWEIGEYDESNTLLLENTPYKALLNPPHTAIFPYPYRYWKTEDDSLGPNGDLRVYLERLAASENVQNFVAENPVGQRPIREKNLSWRFYQKIIRAFSSEPKTDTTNASVTPTLSEPKTDTTTGLVDPILLEPKTDSTTVSAAQTVSEPKSDTNTASVDPTLLEQKTDTTTVSAAQTLSEPKTDTTASVAQTLSEPKTDTTTASAAPTLLEQKTDTTTALTAPTLLEQKADTTTASAARSLHELSVVNSNPSLETVNDGS